MGDREIYILLGSIFCLISVLFSGSRVSTRDIASSYKYVIFNQASVELQSLSWYKTGFVSRQVL